MVAGMKDSLCLYGPPGSGKSTSGELLANDLNLDFYDLDAEIEKRANKAIPQIFEDAGEEGFRKLERKTLKEVSGKHPAVFALGGGSLLDPQNRERVEKLGLVVCLDGELDILLERLKKSNHTRPLVAGDSRNQLKDLLDRRAAHYASFPLKLKTDGKSPKEMSWEIQKKIGWFHVQGMGAGYDVRVANGGFEQLGKTLRQKGIEGQVFLVTDTNVQPLYAEKVTLSLEEENYNFATITIPAGEQHKNLTTISEIWDAFLTAGIDRRSNVIALGGGVVGDLVGFAAATFMRGISWINFPTTLLAMVDAGIGGKTGFDLPQGKNLIGAFHAPKLVISDPEVLTTLPEIEFRCGMAEVVKHGVIGSPTLFEKCALGIPDEPKSLEQLIKEAVSVKIKVIREDPFEQGFREALNYGHTIGHAVELLSGFKIPHGYAVSIGMVSEAKLAQRIGLADQRFVDALIEILARLNLPTEIPEEIEIAQIIQAMQKDKKVANRQIRFSLPEGVGQVKVGVVVEDLEQILQSTNRRKSHG
jgi:3-dehydroquinate synthase